MNVTVEYLHDYQQDLWRIPLGNGVFRLAAERFLTVHTAYIQTCLAVTFKQLFSAPVTNYQIYFPISQAWIPIG